VRAQLYVCSDERPPVPAVTGLHGSGRHLRPPTAGPFLADFSSPPQSTRINLSPHQQPSFGRQPLF